MLLTHTQTHTRSHAAENIKQASRLGALITLLLFPLSSLLSRSSSSSEAPGSNWSPDVSVAYHTHTSFFLFSCSLLVSLSFHSSRLPPSVSKHCLCTCVYTRTQSGSQCDQQCIRYRLKVATSWWSINWCRCIRPASFVSPSPVSADSHRLNQCLSANTNHGCRPQRWSPSPLAQHVSQRHCSVWRHHMQNLQSPRMGISLKILFLNLLVFDSV